jgi:hypothetical protein
MSEDDPERPCLHCMILDLIESFYDKYPAVGGEPDAIDTDKVVTAIGKTVAEITCSRSGANRQEIIEKLMREIMNYDAEFRQADASGGVGSAARH